MAQLTINAGLKGDVRNVNKAIKKAQLDLLRLCRLLRTEIVTNRLNKPRTGNVYRRASGWKYRKTQNKAGFTEFTTTGRSFKKWRASGPPQYPQVLSTDTRRLRQSITARIEDRGDVVVGRVGTNVFYGAIHELQNRGRAWLRPALRDKYDELVRQFGITFSAEMSHLDIKGKTTITETVL